jgi:type VI secretion system Hcp family effector
MAQMKGYFTAKFNKTGAIEGASRVKKIGSKSVEKHVEFWAAEHEITAPRHRDSGQAMGRRVHGDFKITVDAGHKNPSAPLLYNALCTNDRFSEAEFSFFDTNEKGESFEHFTIKIFDGTISGIQFKLPNVMERGNEQEQPLQMQVCWTYSKIEIKNSANKIATDSWEQQS